MKEKRIAWTLAIHTFIFSSICKHVKSVIEPDDRQESALKRIMPIFTIIFILRVYGADTLFSVTFLATPNTLTHSRRL